MLIVSVALLERSLMPWIVASQTVPIIALAPMIVVILNQFDIGGIDAEGGDRRLSLVLPDHRRHGQGPALARSAATRSDAHLFGDARAEVLTKLRAPASLPFFFASMKIGAAAALVGAVVAEVTKSEDGGLGARLLAGSYYGQTVQIWAALFTAAALSGALVGAIDLIGRATLKRMAFPA